MRLVLEIEVRFGKRTPAKTTMMPATTPHKAVVRKTPEKLQAATAIAPSAGPVAHAADQRARNMATPRSVVAFVAWSRCPLAMANNCGKAAALVPRGKQAISSSRLYCVVRASRAYPTVVIRSAENRGIRLGARSNQCPNAVLTRMLLRAKTVRSVPSSSGLRCALSTAKSVMYEPVTASPSPMNRMAAASGTKNGTPLSSRTRSLSIRPVPWLKKMGWLGFAHNQRPKMALF
jgi:hypothetical protein